VTPWIDAAGTAHATAPEARIVCLVPSITELLCDLGLAGQLVGRTGFCIHPREVLRSVAKVGGTKDVDIDRVRALEPTHVIVNIDENTRETAERLAQCVPNLIVTHPLGPLDNPPLYRLLGGIFGRSAEAETLASRFDTALQALRATQTAEHGARPERVLYLIWRDPWMTVGPDTYIARMLGLVGWQAWSPPSTDRYPTLQLGSAAGAVERVLLSSEPYAFRDKHLAEVAAALPDAAVTLIDGEQVSWYGSRAIEGITYLSDYARRARGSNHGAPYVTADC
jgi:ABC-type Fe3+-hydroxamate transport system substrate-binding protein